MFFGLVATAGTTYMLAGVVNQEAWYGAISAGLIACAVLMVNNIRDIVPDKQAAQDAPSLCSSATSRPASCSACSLLVPFGVLAVMAIFYPGAWLGFFALLLAIPACIIVLTAKTSRELILALQLTSFTGLAVAVALGAAYAF